MMSERKKLDLVVHENQRQVIFAKSDEAAKVMNVSSFVRVALVLFGRSRLERQTCAKD